MNAAIAFILTASVAAVYTPVPGAAQSPVFTNAWGVKVVGGLGVANSVAMRQGLTNMGQVSPEHTHSVLLLLTIVAAKESSHTLSYKMGRIIAMFLQVGTLEDMYWFLLPLDKHYHIAALAPYPQITAALLQEDSVFISSDSE